MQAQAQYIRTTLWGGSETDTRQEARKATSGLAPVARQQKAALINLDPGV